MLKNINSERSGYIWLHYVFDLLVPIVVLVQILYFYSLPLRDRYILLGMLGGVLFMVTNQFIGTYDNRRSRTFFINIQKVFNAWFIVWILLVVIAFLSKRSAEYSRAVTLIWAVLTFIVLIGYRFILWLLLHYYLKKTDKSRSIAVLGVGNIGQYLSSIIQKNPFLGYQVIGYYDDNPESGKDFINGLPILGNSEKALADAESGKFQELYLCMPLGSEEKIKSYLNRLTNSSVIVKIIPDFLLLI